MFIFSDAFFGEYIMPLIMMGYIGYSAFSPELSEEQRRNGVIYGLVGLVGLMVMEGWSEFFQ